MHNLMLRPAGGVSSALSPVLVASGRKKVHGAVGREPKP